MSSKFISLYGHKALNTEHEVLQHVEEEDDHELQQGGGQQVDVALAKEFHRPELSSQG